MPARGQWTGSPWASRASIPPTIIIGEGSGLESGLKVIHVVSALVEKANTIVHPKLWVKLRAVSVIGHWACNNVATSPTRKPLDVVPEHRKRATVIWGALLLAIVGYTALQIAALHSKFDNPSTNFSVSNDLYAFPPLEICFWPGRGCDEMFSLEDCVASVTATAYDPRNKEIENSQFKSQWANCLGFNLTVLDMPGFEYEDSGSRSQTRPSTTVTMSWKINSSNKNSYRKVVGVFLGNDSAAELIKVPYSRVVNSPDSDSDQATFIETGITIGKNIRNFISGVSNISYHALTISTGDFVDPTPFGNNANNNSSRGHLHLTLTQGAFSLTELSDINPLDISTLLGNIGGFWEILLVTWGLCFIASTRDSPTQRGRDFSHPIRKGKELLSRKKRSITQTAPSDPEGGGGEEPYWIAEERGRTNVSGVRSARVIPPVGNHEPPKRAASFFRRPTGHDYPMRPGSSFTRSVDTGEGSVESCGSCVDSQTNLAA